MIENLVDNLKGLIEEKGGLDESSTLFGEACSEIYSRRFVAKDAEEKGGSLRMSNLGTPCAKRLWYTCNTDSEMSKIDAEAELKFSYGDILEALLIQMAKDAGHKVTHEQQELDILGIKGHLDCVIDGMVVDVKSASPFGFNKFKYHGLRKDDPFGYLEQISSYLYALKDDPEVTYKDTAAFLAINKVTGELVLDVYNVKDLLATKETKIKRLKKIISEPKAPPRGFKDVKSGESGNRELCKTCYWCPFKFTCWENLRVFEYAKEDKYLTRVVKMPNVPERKRT